MCLVQRTKADIQLVQDPSRECRTHVPSHATIVPGARPNPYLVPKLQIQNCHVGSHKVVMGISSVRKRNCFYVSIENKFSVHVREIPVSCHPEEHVDTRDFARENAGGRIVGFADVGHNNVEKDRCVIRKGRQILR